MPRFSYSAFTAAGRIENGEVEARSAEEAANLLNARGLTPFETTSAQPKPHGRSLFPAKRVALRDLAPFMREIATLLEAELPVDEALRILAERRASPRAKRLAQALVEDIRSGAALSDSFAKHAQGAPLFAASLIRAGEARGSLGPTLSEIARLLEARADIESRIRSALTYPLLLLAITMCTLAIVFSYLFPALLRMFEDSGMEPPAVVLIVRDVARFIDANWVWLGTVSALLGVSGVVSLWRSGHRESLDRFLLALPAIGDIRRDTSTAILARTLGLLVRNGVPLVGALEVAARAVPSLTIADSVIQAAGKIKEGERLSDGLGGSGALPDIAVRLISIGEEAGKLDVMLIHCADMFERDTAHRVDSIVTLLSPAITILVGLLIGGIVLSVMEAILSVNSLAMR